MTSTIRRLSNGFVMAALRAGLPIPPYTRSNGIIVETRGRRSDKRRRTPVGYLEDGERLLVIAEHGAKASYVRNALADGARVRVFHRGRWKDARLRLLDEDAEPVLRRMARTHAAAVRRLGTDLRVVAIVPE